MLNGLKKYKIFFPIYMNEGWLGGVNYYKNLFHAITLIPGKPIEAYIPDDGNPDILYKYANAKNKLRKKDFKYKLTKVLTLLSGKKFNKEEYFSKHITTFDLNSHAYIFDDKTFGLTWIPDLQHKCLPEIFSEDELFLREQFYANAMEPSSLIIVSSNAVKKDFEIFYPEYANKTRVLNFVSYIDPKIYDKTDKLKEAVKNKYNLPDKYFYLPNQFWMHKNHITVLKAVNKLKQEGINVHIVCSGNTEDYRNKNYFNDVIMKYINDNNLQDNIHILGIIDLNEVYCLMRNCVSVINPSLFEGWSSTVEEVKSLGKNIILSDLDVHKEQNPPCAEYFARNDYNELATIMLEKWNSPPIEKDKKLEKQAKAKMKSRLQEFGKNYLSIVEEFMTHKKPKLTIVTVVYNLIKSNRIEYFEKCINSVHNQTYKNVEHIVIDGASTDGTLDVLKEYEGKGWIKLFSEPDNGIYDAMNKGLQKATGDYVTFLNSDDFYHDTKGLEHVASTLRKRNVDFTYSTSNYVYENEDLYGVTAPVPESFFIRMPFYHQTLFVKTDLMKKLGGFDLNFKSASDYDFIIRLFLSRATHSETDYNFVSYRLGGFSCEDQSVSFSECIKSFEKNYSEFAKQENLEINFNDMFHSCTMNEKLHNIILDKVSTLTKIKMINSWKQYPIIDDNTKYVNNVCLTKTVGNLHKEKTTKKISLGIIPLYKLIKSETEFKKYILGIPYSSFQNKGNYVVKRTLFQLLKKEKSYFYTKYYLLGIKIWHKNKSKIDILTDKISDLQKDTRNIKIEMETRIQTLQNNINTEINNMNIETQKNIQSLSQKNIIDYFPVNSEANDEMIAEENRYIEPIQTTSCKICGGESKLLFRSKIFHNRYDAEYYYCPNCGFLQAANLEWLNEAYNTPVTQEDTGVLLRNLYLRKYLSIILFNLINPNGKYLDYGGGYGLLSRLLRDIGFEFYHYDKYCENIFAQGFEGSLTDRYDSVTSIEAFEHFDNPLEEIEQMLKLSDTILFTEEILPTPAPEPSEWWYYCLNHGQHISFYSNKTLKYIANKYGLNYYNVYNLHILSKQNFEAKINYLKTKNTDYLFIEVEKSMQPLTVNDMNYIIEMTNK